MELPAEMFVKPLDADADTFAFRYGFELAGKALEDGTAGQIITENEDGDLIIEGYAAVFDGTDRQGENFTDGAFNRGIKSFLGGQSALCYHHKHDKVLGKVLELEEIEGKGLRMKARVDGAIRNHPELGTIYQQIKKGTINALSVGGFFKRALTAAGQKIVDMDFTEVSVTPVPVHPGTNFAVIAGKALLSDVEVPDVPNPDGEVRTEDVRQLQYLVQELDSVFQRIMDGVSKRGAGSKTPPKPPTYD